MAQSPDPTVTDLRREHIVMPHRDDKDDPAAWRQTAKAVTG